jgi:hypothetical protein
MRKAFLLLATLIAASCQAKPDPNVIGSRFVANLKSQGDWTAVSTGVWPQETFVANAELREAGKTYRFLLTDTGKYELVSVAAGTSVADEFAPVVSFTFEGPDAGVQDGEKVPASEQARLLSLSRQLVGAYRDAKRLR